MKALFIVLTAILSSLPAIVQAEPLRLEAGLSWQMEKGRDSCALIREFSDGRHDVLLELRQFYPDTDFRATLIGDGFNVARTGRPVFRIEPDTLPLSVPLFTRYRMGDSTEGLLFNLSLTDPANLMSLDEAMAKAGERAKDAPPASAPDDGFERRLRAMTGLFVGNVFSRDFVLAIGPMDGPMEMMRECTDALVAGWGLDPDQQRKRSRAPMATNLADIQRILAEDFPRRGLAHGVSNTVAIRLLVDADGKPSDCLVEPPAFPEYRAAACEVLLRSLKLEPALDETGRPFASYYATKVIFLVQR